MELWHDAYASHGECGEMDFDPSFKKVSMMEQLGRIIDSGKIVPGVDLPEHKYHPVSTVVTDDGHEIAVHAKEAEIIRDAVLNVPVKDRLDVIKELQTTKGFTAVLKQVTI